MLPFHRRQECTMTDTPGKRSIWLRGLLMILMAMAFQISCSRC